MMHDETERNETAAAMAAAAAAAAAAAEVEEADEVEADEGMVVRIDCPAALDTADNNRSGQRRRFRPSMATVVVWVENVPHDARVKLDVRVYRHPHHLDEEERAAWLDEHEDKLWFWGREANLPVKLVSHIGGKCKYVVNLNEHNNHDLAPVSYGIFTLRGHYPRSRQFRLVARATCVTSDGDDLEAENAHLFVIDTRASKAKRKAQSAAPNGRALKHPKGAKDDDKDDGGATTPSNGSSSAR